MWEEENGQVSSPRDAAHCQQREAEHIGHIVKPLLLGTLSSDDDDAGENVRKTIVLISKTLAVHLRYNLWYISLPSNAKQRREMTTIKVFWRTSTPND